MENKKNMEQKGRLLFVEGGKNPVNLVEGDMLTDAYTGRRLVCGGWISNAGSDSCLDARPYGGPNFHPIFYMESASSEHGVAVLGDANYSVVQRAGVGRSAIHLTHKHKTPIVRSAEYAVAMGHINGMKEDLKRRAKLKEKKTVEDKVA